jgi:nucleoside-diphosphate-sugar epimerase
MPSPLLIAGCGYLGRELARQALSAGHRVWALTRTAESAAELSVSGIPAMQADLSDAASIRRAAENCPPGTAVVHCAAGGKGGGTDTYRAIYLQGMHNLRMALPDAPRFVFTSSSSVYAQIDGSVINEDSPALPVRETGRILREAEEVALERGGIVLRLAGIYGPARSVLLRQFLAGESVIDVRTEPPATPDGRWVNHTHRDDAAAALLMAATGELPPGVYNCADSTPMLQRTIYTELSRRFALPLPPEAPPDHTRKRGWTHKQVDNTRLRAAGWEPRYPSWFHALDHDAGLVSSILHQ